MFKLFCENKDLRWVIKQKEHINFSPRYQRTGGLWSKSQKQLLIDSILNGYDIPKLYFQFLPLVEKPGDQVFTYGVIDGKQRLEAILDFVEDRFPLSSDFVFLNQSTQKYYSNIAGKTFSEIDKEEPSLIAKFMEYSLSIVFIDTDDGDIINSIFVRLNSGLQVNTIEKRNAIGGELMRNIGDLCAKSVFFKEKIRLSNARYAHYDLALKLLMIEMGADDLSKKEVDDFVSNNKNFDQDCQNAIDIVEMKLERFSSEFENKDRFLVIKNLIITLYSIIDQIPLNQIKNFLNHFESLRMQNKIEIKEEKTITNPQMTEFSRQLQQGADKSSSLVSRKHIMEHYLSEYLKAN